MNSSPRYLADYKAADFTIKTVNLTIELDDTQNKVISELSIIRQTDNKKPLILNGEYLTLISVLLDDKKLLASDYDLSEKFLCIPTNKDNFKLTIVTMINPKKNTALEGLYKSGDAFCTQCEAEGFRRITYYLDRPDVMAVFTTTIIANKACYPYLLSNGNKIKEGDLDNKKHFVTWHDPFPKPCYLFALVAGDFDLLQDSYVTTSGRKVALEIFVDKGNVTKAEHAMASLKKSMKWDEDVFNLEYDLDIYMIVAVDFFNMGAMENKGLNVFNSKFVLADTQSATDVDYFNIESVIAHEYFHNWTGNRVTCRDWFQLSLKEGLTVFRDQQFSADMHSSAVTRIQNVRVLRSLQFAEDAGPMAHPIRPEKVIEMNNFYTLTVYEKGAEVIRMLYTLLGKYNFNKGMELYFKRFDGMAVTCDDFINAMADASDKDLMQFKLWYSLSGTPIVSVIEEYCINNKTLTITLSQKLPITANQPVVEALHIPIKIEILSDNNRKNSVHTLELTSESQKWVFSDLQSQPTIAYLVDFSAPVKLNHKQSESELITLIAQVDNSFCKWDAVQKIFMLALTNLTLNSSYVLSQSLIECLDKIISSNEDKAFVAELLILPSFDEAADSIEEVDPIALSNAINQLSLFIVKGLESKLLACFNSCKQNIKETESVENRALKNVCLQYLTILPQYISLAEEQYKTANNMTDSLATLTCASKNDLAFKRQLSLFEEKWQSTALVMDKWFAIQACWSSDKIFEQLKQLLNHPLFSIKNPNRARSLIGAFAMNNPKYFHCPSGKGYVFLRQQIENLNKINPQIASRLITPLIQYKSFSKLHQDLMKEQLLKLQSLNDLSNDLKEKLDASLPE